MRHVLAALLLLGLLTSCASTATDDARPSLAEAQQSNGAVVPGYSLSIAKLGIDRAVMTSLGLNSDGSIQVPPLSRPRELGVYANGPMPGQTGPAVILGHVSARGIPGAFARLDTLRVGDEIDTTAPDGSATRFVVYRTQVVPKEQFPTKSVYGDRNGVEAVLITCGGALDTTRHEYDSNVIVWARKA